MLTMLAQVFIAALALLATEWLLPGIAIDNFYTAVIVAIVLGLLHLLVRPILVILTLPITILTLGLFMFVINAFLFLVAAYFVDGFVVEGFIPALIGSIIVSILSSVGGGLLERSK